MARILIAETQEDLATAMNERLSLDHYTVESEENGWQILECLRLQHFDVIAMEIALRGLDGISVVRQFRAAGGITPIVLLTGKSGSEELTTSLDAGADAYLAKPFSLEAFSAQLRALLRRPALRSEKILSSGGLAMDTQSGTVTKNDVLVHLHPMEFRLLQFLLRHPDTVFNAYALSERVWQKESASTDETVRQHIRTLRKKIDSEGSPSIITTVRGLGYKAESH